MQSNALKVRVFLHDDAQHLPPETHSRWSVQSCNVSVNIDVLITDVQPASVVPALGLLMDLLVQGLDLQHSPSNAGARAIPLVECLQIFSAYTLSTFNTSVQFQV